MNTPVDTPAIPTPRQLRILTGLHAGTRLNLKRRRYTLGRGGDADIQISDWQGSSVTLLLKTGKPALLLPPEPEGGYPERVQPLARLADFAPQRCQDVVLCVGPVGGPWPSDVTLMSRLLQAEAPPRKRPAAAWSGALAGLLVVGATDGLALRPSADARAHAPAKPLAERVREALDPQTLALLTLREAGPGVTVEGLLPDAGAVARTRAALLPLGTDAVQHRYAAASDLVQSIGDALGDSALSVRYDGHGVFTVHGRAVEPERLAPSVRRIAGDLAPLVARIDLQVAASPAPQRHRIGAVMAAPDGGYVQTADGTRHLSPGAGMR